MSNKSLFGSGFNQRNSRYNKEVPLDESQLKCVTSKDNKILVVAGAGSGKTSVLTERVKHLLETGVRPHNIIAITFTNIAAEEIKERLYDVQGIGDAFIGTIHSFANRIMKNTGKHYHIFTTTIENDCMGYLIDTYAKFLTLEAFLEYKDLQDQALLGKVDELTPSQVFLPSALAEFNWFMRSAEVTERDNAMTADQEDIADRGPTIQNPKNYPESVGTLCKARNIIDFSQLLKMAKEYFDENNSEIEHVLVDEFQDVSSLEYSFVESLQAKNYFLVGDDWQAIYGFKGGNVNLFLSLAESGEYSVFHLTNNYRNSSEVLNVAHTVIEQVPDRIEKAIYQVKDTEGEVRIISKKLLENVLESLKQESEYSDWFFLVRQNKELNEVSQLMQEMNIPYSSFRREGLALNDLNNLLSQNTVKLLTVHTAKGMESKNVILYGNFPVEAQRHLRKAEERRVMYVGCTRAKENLLIMN